MRCPHDQSAGLLDSQLGWGAANHPEIGLDVCIKRFVGDRLEVKVGEKCPRV